MRQPADARRAVGRVRLAPGRTTIVPRHLLSLADLNTAEVNRLFEITADLKSKLADGVRPPLLAGRVMAMVFEKPSLRTRVSFEAGMGQLGGNTLFLGADAGFRKRESIEDFGRVLSEYVDAIVVRCYAHDTLATLARCASCSVINGLSDFSHPCQALADLFTLRELRGKLAGLTLAWIGDCNNVARSLALGCGRTGVRMLVACPAPYRFSDEELAWIRRHAPDLDFAFIDDPYDAVARADAVYTDVWVSMGQEKEREERIAVFSPYQVNGGLMAAAPNHAVFMHCLPAHRGEEVTDEVIDGPNSVVIQQAGNRMHVQKAILVWLLGAVAGAE